MQMDHMDWYFSTVRDGPVVPNNREALVPSIDDISPSPDDWFQWEFDAFDWKSSSVKFGLEPLVHMGEGCSNHSECGQISLADCSARTSETSSHGHWPLGDRPDYQLQNSMERNDDIFLNSLLKVDSPMLENPYKSLNMFPNSAYSSTSSENLLADMVVDHQNFMKDPTCMGSSTYMKSWDSLSVDDSAELGDRLEDSASCLIADDSRSEGSPMAPMLTVLSPSQVNAPSETVALVHEKKCLEETVLQDLEDIMTQLNRRTRICFRDALYRLAKSSKEQYSINQNKNVNFISHGTSVAEVTSESLSHTRPKSVESKTNGIDRTIANLMFNNSSCGPMDLSTAPLIQESKEDTTGSGSYNYIIKQPLVPPHSDGPTSLPCEVSIPLSDKEDSNSSQLLYELSSTKPALAMEYISHTSSY